MASYVASTKEQQQEMLEAIGQKDFNGLFSQIPEAVRIKGTLNIPQGKSELEVRRILEEMADTNRIFKSIFRGAGAYNHYIPAIVKNVTAKEAFVTTYTPYQAEVSQGILQSIFEYQTMICELTGMDVSNASIYDGASAAAEAVAMCRERKRVKALISAAAHPQVIETIKTYCWAAGTLVEIIPEKDGLTDLDALSGMLDGETACVYIQQPNYFGLIENADTVGELAHSQGVKFIIGINPIAAAVLKTPGECGADIAVGEGQPLGMPLAFGGPYLGFMAATKAMMRKLPGRIVGETTDGEGRRAFVLTLQAREQHIRREKASSNVCSNQALCALTASVYLSAMGPGGLRDVAVQSMSKAHYLADKLAEIGLTRRFSGEYFHEFITDCKNPEQLVNSLMRYDILGGLPLEGGILWCTTEMNTKKDIDTLVQKLKEAGKE